MVGPPKKHFLPLILFVSLFGLFFFSHFHSNNFTSKIATTNTLNPQTILPFTFLIKVLAFNRLDSLSRCLRSLSAASYGGDTVHLHIYIDHFPLNNESSEILRKKLEGVSRILEYVDGYNWKYGNKVVHYRSANVGLQGQWLEAWWPSNEDEFVFIVEDDLEVSPLFYKFVKNVIFNYYYNASNLNPSIYGLSLQRPRFVPGKHGNKIHLDSGTQLFLYQLVGTWGQILFPRPWKQFRLWYDKNKAEGVKPLLDGMVTTGWYKRMGERIWTPWFIKFIHSRGYFNIYTNFQHERALSVSHRDPGVNYGKTVGPDSQLLDASSVDDKFLKMPPLSNLKWYDFCFGEVLPGRVVKTLDDLRPVLLSLQKQHTVRLVSILGAKDEIIKNMLCHFERLNIQNYIILGSHSDFLLDLARRGHPVIDADELLSNIRFQKSIRYRDSSSKLMKDILLKAYIIKKLLEDGYNSWIVDANTLFVSKEMLHEFINPLDDNFYAGRSSGFFFTWSSSGKFHLTDSLLNKITAAVDKVALAGETGSFISIFPKLLERNGVRVHWVDEKNFATKIGTGGVDQSALDAGTRMVYWSAETSLETIQKELEELSLWVIDGDSTCKAVVCHQS